MSVLVRSDNGVIHFGHCPSSCILNRKQRAVNRTCLRPHMKGWRSNRRVRPDRSELLSRYLFMPSPVDRKGVAFRNNVFCSEC